MADTAPDIAVVDCLMFGALGAMEQTHTPTAALIHSAPGLLMAPGSPMEGLLLGAVNELRVRAGRVPVARLWDAWSAFPGIDHPGDGPTGGVRTVLLPLCRASLRPGISLGLATSITGRRPSSFGAHQLRQHIGVGPAVKDPANP